MFWIVLLLCALPVVCIFAYAILCSCAVVCLFARKYQMAERLYKLTLAIRQNMPIIGATARTDFWNVSLANCYREQGRGDEAERLYRSVMDRPDPKDFLNHLTTYGIKATAAENYAELLKRTGRAQEAESISATIGSSAAVLRLKYAVVCLFVLGGGMIFAFWANAQLDKLTN